MQGWTDIATGKKYFIHLGDGEFHKGYIKMEQG